ncbi:MAG: serine/threonine-protein kinase [Isosphaeraceae bacterium]|nr:serine/threonine-protein kinase [Isosphaeraceae bacterium]
MSETIPYPPEPSRADFGSGSWPPEDDGFPEVDDLPDSTLGQYRLEEAVGRGSMGRVYRAEHLGLGRPCAIKVMNPGLVANEPKIRERFWAEARAVAHLVHPNIVTVHNLGSDRGYHFIEMEYVPGGFSLRETLVNQGPFEPIRASEVVRQVVQGLGAAHAAGLVHRDVKPSNVLMTAEGSAKLADFGLVRHRTELHLAGVPAAGTPTFMAPELFAGVPASPRSDFYAVGVMYYYLLSGMLPFASDQISQLVQLHRREPVPDIRRVIADVPEAVKDILDRCLAKRPEHRYVKADELADDLQAAVYRLRETESLVRESLEGLDCFVQGGRDNYRILFQLPGDRLQEVYLEAAGGKQGERLLSVFSVCGVADPGFFETALKLNAKLTYGSLSIRSVNGQPMFVMTRTFPRDHVCAADVRAALLEIARRADRVEQQLSSADLY